MNQNKTYLGPDLKIEGNIECVNDIEIHGEVYGNITCANDILINGHVEGDITGRNISIRNQYLDCNLHASGDVVIEEATDFKGNIEAQNLRINGFCIGDIQVADRLIVGATAMIQGNINASFVTIEEGAKINGNVTIVHEETA